MNLYCAWGSFLQNWDRRIINKIYYYYYHLIKNGKGEGGGKKGGGGGGGWSEGSRKDWAELYGCIK